MRCPADVPHAAKPVAPDAMARAAPGSTCVGMLAGLRGRHAIVRVAADP